MAMAPQADTSRLVFFGSSPFAAVVLQKLIDAQQKPLVLYTRAPQPSGRGMRLTPTLCAVLAEKNDIPVYTPQNWRDATAAEIMANLAALSPDLGIIVAYGMILPQSLLDIPRLGCVNLHGSLLPRWRGAAPIERAILAGDRETGVTLMQMVAKLDAGAILAKSVCPIDGTSTGGALHQKLAEMAAGLLIDNLPRLLRGELVAEAQDENLVTYAEKIDRNRDCLLDFSQSADQVLRQINAFFPKPGAFAYCHHMNNSAPGERIKILSAEILSHRPHIETGITPSFFEGRIINFWPSTVGTVYGICCREKSGFSILVPGLIQRAGKPPIKWEEFSRTITAGDYFSASELPRTI